VLPFPLFDSLRRYEPDQVLRDFLSRASLPDLAVMHPAWHPCLFSI